MASKPSHDTLIHCESCGEDYSATYRRCPFCGGRNSAKRTAPANRSGDPLEDTYVFDGQDAFDEEPEEENTSRPKGGKRLAPKQGGGFELPPVNWPRLITFLCSLVIIVAALIIVFTVIYPQLHGASKPKESDQPSAPSGAVSTAPDPVGSQDVVRPSGDVSEPSDPPVDTAPVQVPVTGITLKSDGRTLSANDITLYVGQSTQMSAVVAPASWSGTVTWTSSNPEWLSVSDTGYVSNVNKSGQYHNVNITVTAGDFSVQCIVRVQAREFNAPASQPPASQPPASDPPVVVTATPGGVTVGRQGTIVNAAGGLRVRPDPSTSNPPIASLVNGQTVTVVANVGNGWYQISFAGSNGAAMTGYIMGNYISTN